MRDELEAIYARARQLKIEIRSADTPENEARLVDLLKSKGIKVKRGRQKGANRYTVKVTNGSIGPVSLYDLEEICRKIFGEKEFLTAIKAIDHPKWIRAHSRIASQIRQKLQPHNSDRVGSVLKGRAAR
ncbi:hypothetical protein [Mesorhizobium sp.]|uniref:hypothetical protein n=1 Tax=Mesorhizobium sp. TaxID=1871066 RepID=UPI000FE8430C|nr:hypothetical protein [Mesorhizobium sp.]RWF99701.1 MAG: hypothetical protein EOQ54_28735 [Mesorhizobium sp.]RWG94306.1 MAG: hypothetical protein EOQ72_27880 [Mesorhizobium sp.]TIR89654.1 MAG: hypothetical protein E5X08_26665 [Mesorhizobium sp.]TIS02911.1 MAG: hypothetical protein E5X13_08235 [Mesorhizobium sp.]